MGKYFDVTLLLILLIFALFTVIITTDQYSNKAVGKIECRITDSDSVKFIEGVDIENLLRSREVRGLWQKYSETNLDSLEKIISKNQYVDSVELFLTVNGLLELDIKQRNAVVRVMTLEGDDFYMDSSFKRMEICEKYVANVPVVSCSEAILNFLIEEQKKVGVNCDYLQKLFNFVYFVENDSFWQNMIVQINITDQKELEIVPRVGPRKVVVCNLEQLSQFEEATKKLKAFYFSVLKNNGWNSYSTINLTFDNIVVATKY